MLGLVGRRRRQPQQLLAPPVALMVLAAVHTRAVGAQQTNTTNVACLLAICEANPQASMCASSASCTDSEQGKCWAADGSDPCADGWRGVSCSPCADAGEDCCASFEDFNDDGVYDDADQPACIAGFSPSAEVAMTSAEVDCDETPMHRMCCPSCGYTSYTDCSSTGIPNYDCEGGPPAGTAVLALNLRGTGLGAIPPQIAQCADLMKLNVAANQLPALPAQLGQLRNLRELKASHTGLVALPAEIQQLPILETMEIRFNQFPQAYSFPKPPSLARCPGSFGLRGNECELCGAASDADGCAQTTTGFVAALLAFCDMNPQAAMCASSGDCVGTEWAGGHYCGSFLGGRYSGVMIGVMTERCPDGVADGTWIPAQGNCWAADGSDPCADGWRGVACGEPYQPGAAGRASNGLPLCSCIEGYSCESEDYGDTLECVTDEGSGRAPGRTLPMYSTSTYAGDPELRVLVVVTDLDLQNTGLAVVPPQIAHFANLRGLNLADNRLVALPPQIGQLPNLGGLDLRHNELTELPPEIGLLANLKVLELGGNQLTELPPELWQISAQGDARGTGFEELYLCDRPITSKQAIIEGTCNPLPQSYWFEPLPATPRQCPAFDPPFVFRGGVCEMCERVDGQDVFVSALLIIVGTSLGFYVLFRFTGDSADQEAFRDVLENRETVKDAQGVLAESAEARLIGGHISSLAKIVTAQLQQSFAFISWNWGWPNLLVDVRLWLGSFVLPDMAAITNADCLAGGGDSTAMARGAALPLFVLFTLICVGCCSFYTRRKAEKGDESEDQAVSDSQAAAARAAHLSNFGWALFTLASPIAVTGITQLMTDSKFTGYVYLLLPPFMLLIPLYALWNLRKAKVAGVLRSPAFEARYGWLCSRYRADSLGPYWELVVLLTRFSTIFMGSAAEIDRAPTAGAVSVIIITLVLLAMQTKFKPFQETPEQAAHWSSANKMAQLGYTCQLVILLVGLIATLGAPLGDAIAILLALPALVALFVPLTLTVIIIKGVDVGDGGPAGAQGLETGEAAAGEQDGSAKAEDSVSVENPAAGAKKELGEG